MRIYLILFLFITGLCIQANTYTVTGTGNSGAGTLHAAIDSANTHSGLDTINFNLGAGGPFTILLTSALPAITDNSGVLINGWDNSGNNGTQNSVSPVNTSTTTPMNAVYKIVVSNSNGNVNTGLTVTSNNNTIQGLVFPNFGVTTLSVRDTCIIVRGNSNKILGCYIGIDSTGTTGNNRTEYAVSLRGNNNNIGNGTAAGANIISGTNDSLNGYGGIFILGSTSTGNTIKGNMIGLQKDGESATSVEKQREGIWIEGATYTTIGGTSAAEGNVISGNQHRGIYMASTSGNNTVIGNIIGTKASGQAIVSGVTQPSGIYIVSYNNSIGNGTSAGRNIISGNTTGIYIDGSTATGNSVRGNYIGIAKDGTSYLTSNAQSCGVFLTQSSFNIIGGIGSGDGNVISGNGNTGSGITIYNSGPPAAHDETVIGNIIGPQKDGSTFLSNNQEYGIVIHGNANIIGGSTSAHRNIISANGKYGVYLISPGGNCTDNVVKGNYIGIASNGTSVISSSSQDFGVYISAVTLNTQPRGNVIGGLATSEANVISGNNDGSSAGIGVYIETTHSKGNSVLGNIIGPQKDGTTFLSNIQKTGVKLNNSQYITIGGTATSDRNIISGNGGYGIYVRGASASGNLIKGNYLGLASNGSSSITSSGQDIGAYFAASCFKNTLGGNNSGEGNVISGNHIGVKIDSSATLNTVAGNIIGLNAAGTAGLSLAQTYGVYIQSSPSNTIGGTSSSYRNVITGNTYGILVNGATSTGTTIKANYVGLNAAGTAYVSSPAQVNGIQIGDAINALNPSGVIIGGATSGEANVVSGNSNYGIFLTLYSGSTQIKGNIIGLQANGTSLVSGASQVYGVFVSRCANNTIGGTATGEGNTISGNTTAGILLSGTEASGNSMQGNYIGPQSTGTTSVSSSSQDYGIYLFNNTYKNTVNKNLISGNTQYGCYLTSSTIGSNTITANIIGPQINGSSNLGLQVTGIYISNNPSTVIGGSSTTLRNIISANTTSGIYLINSGIGASSISGTIIKGNYIGLASNGTSFISSSSQDYGVHVHSSVLSITIGGTATGDGNVISGNTDRGIYLDGGGKDLIAGNIIGAAASGTTSIGSSNQSYGIFVSSSGSNLIGGTSTGYRNIISDNKTYGVYLTGSASSGNSIRGNYIGTATDGGTFISSSSQDFGIVFTSSAKNNTVGGASGNDGNVISGNGIAAGGSGYGIYTNSDGANTITGNIIGPKADGQTFINQYQEQGIYISDSPNNIIGGSTSLTRNVISGQRYYGVYITGSLASGNSIKGNYIGIANNGTSFITSSAQQYGVYLNASVSSTMIGGTGSGEGNLLSGNWSAVTMNSTNTNNTIRGNIMGAIQSDGSTALSGATCYYGINLIGAANNTIGGSTSGARNIISNNSIAGIMLQDAASGNSIKGNYIGTNSSGKAAIGTQPAGILLQNNLTVPVTIGGTGTGDGNLISGNSTYGIEILDSIAGSTVLGNIIGPAVSGDSLLSSGTQQYGIYVSTSKNNTIGGSVSGARNIISANDQYGIYITGSKSTGNTINGNYIGTGSNGSSQISSSSQDYGVYITSNASSNTIGGYSTAGDPNTIAHNTADGVFISGESTHYNLISRNKIYSNTNKGINLNSTGNDNRSAPVITLVTGTSVSGTITSSGSDSVEVFKNSTGNCQDAPTYLGTVKATGTSWTLTGISVAPGEKVTATVRTNANNNTSELSAACLGPDTGGFHITVSPNPVDLCKDSSVTLTASGAESYTWSPATGLSATTGAVVIASPTVTTTYTVTGITGEASTTTTVLVVVTNCSLQCANCITSFAPLKGKKYVLGAWVMESNGDTLSNYTSPVIKLSFTGSATTYTMVASGKIIDGWQRVESEFIVPSAATEIKVELINASIVSGKNVFFDDIRIHPFDANMKSFVYDPLTLRLVAELDNNNYATLYEYDEDGALVRVKKETERGIMTIKENKNSTVKK